MGAEDLGGAPANEANNMIAPGDQDPQSQRAILDKIIETNNQPGMEEALKKWLQDHQVDPGGIPHVSMTRSQLEALMHAPPEARGNLREEYGVPSAPGGRYTFLSVNIIPASTDSNPSTGASRPLLVDVGEDDFGTIFDRPIQDPPSQRATHDEMIIRDEEADMRVAYNRWLERRGIDPNSGRCLYFFPPEHESYQINY